MIAWVAEPEPHVKCLVRGDARLVFFATDTKEEGYTKLIRALCAHQNVNMVDIDSREKLGQYVGLYKTDKLGKIREDKKKIGCSCVVIREFGHKSDSLTRVLQSLS